MSFRDIRQYSNTVTMPCVIQSRLPIIADIVHRDLYIRICCAGGRWGSCIMLIIRSYITGKVPIMPRPYNIPWFNFANLSPGRLNGPNFGLIPLVSSRPPTFNPPLRRGGGKEIYIRVLQRSDFLIRGPTWTRRRGRNFREERRRR